MLIAFYKKYILNFKVPSYTSRGVMRQKESWFLFIRNTKFPVVFGIGECSVLKGLSADDRDDYEEKLKEVCKKVQRHNYWLKNGLREFPSIKFGLEMALRDLDNHGSKTLFENSFSRGETPMPINGLIWMGSSKYMLEQIERKLEDGYQCIKMKIGAINFAEELKLLRDIRSEFSSKEVGLRVDANGAFKPEEALEKLKRLSEHDLHSIEQPIMAGQWEEMARLCERSPLPIALDEELIGVFDAVEKEELLDAIKPQYIILKPSLLGGYQASNEWIRLAEDRSIGWWITSALESNIGLSAIAQWTASLNTTVPQGLGTGQLYTNNIPSPLSINSGKLYYGNSSGWDLGPLFNS